MPVQKSQGALRPQAPRPDELPEGVQAAEQAEHRAERRSDGTFAPGARTAQRKGGKARAGKTRLATLGALGPRLMADPGFKPFLQAAKDYERAQTAQLARTVGGGFCGPGPASLITTASLQLAASRYLFAKAVETGDDELLTRASKLGADSRQSLLTATELCAREAVAAPRETPQERLQRELAEMKERT